MDEADKQEEDTPVDRVDVAAAVKELQVRRTDVQRQAEAMKEQGLSQCVIGEQDARLMRTANHGHQVAYNAQIAVDSAHHLIAAFDLTNECNDYRLLHPMAQQGKQALDIESLTVVADTGYSNGEHGERCEQTQITAIVPRAQTVNPEGKQYFSRDRFSYDTQTDSYQCPAGAMLSVGKVSYTQAKKEYWNRKACEECALKPQCTAAAKRTIVRSFHEDSREAMHHRAMSDRKWMKLRQSLAEHPFGTMKWMMGYPRFLVRGLVKARSELALGVLCYNLKRVINMLGTQQLLLAVRAAPT